MTSSAPRVLIVDDEPMVRRSMSRVVESMGYTTVIAESADHALPLVDGELSLVCTDSRMPGMPVTEFIQYLRKHHPRLPILVLSGLVDEGLLGMQATYRFAVGLKPLTSGGLKAKFDEARSLVEAADPT